MQLASWSQLLRDLAEPPGPDTVEWLALDRSDNAETDVAVSTLVSVRDRVIQSYEDIMKMPI